MKFIDSSSFLKSEFIDNNRPLQQINKLLLFALSATANIPQLLLRTIFPSSIEKIKPATSAE